MYSVFQLINLRRVMQTFDRYLYSNIQLFQLFYQQTHIIMPFEMKDLVIFNFARSHKTFHIFN